MTRQMPYEPPATSVLFGLVVFAIRVLTSRWVKERGPVNECPLDPLKA